MGGGDLLPSTDVYHYARVPIDRIITGLCHIIVTHSTDEDDAIEEYYEHWGTASSIAITGAADDGSSNTVITTDGSHGFSNGDVVWIDGTTNYEGSWAISSASGGVFTIQTPFQSPDNQTGTAYLEGANDPPIGAQYSAPFQGSQTTAPSPRRTGDGLRLGDHDTFLFNVTAAVHLGAPTLTDSHNPSGYTTDSGTWYESITHPKCQSFVRSTLLSRHNNAYGMTSRYLKYGIDTLHQSGRVAGNITSQATASNMVHNGFYSDEDGNFEVDLASSANNTYFTPVYDIKFEAYHPFTLTENVHASSPGNGNPTIYQVDTHPVDFYNLLCKIKLYSFDKAGDRNVTEVSTGVTGGTTVTHFRNRTNVYWQPFGETSELKFGKTPYTS